jgi:hypothetical protein
MVDDPPPVDTTNMKEAGDVADSTAASLANLGSMAYSAQAAFDVLGGQVKQASTIFQSFDSAMREVGISFSVNKALTQDQTTQFALLSNAMLGARDSYKSFTGVDSSGLSTFTEQIQYITSTLGNTESGIGALVSVAKNAFGKEVPAAIKGSFGAVEQFVVNLAKSADNGLKLQNAVIQLAGKTGNLNTVFELAGPKLQNINALLQKHAQMMADATQATGVAPEMVEKYYSELGQVPGALESLVTSTGNANQKTTMLTAAMKVAAGTGRSFEEIVDDLKVAFKDYGMTGENALKFSSQISAVTQNLGVELSTVRDALRSGAEAFKMFANAGESASRMSTGMAEVMNNYAKALESTGLNGTAAVDVIRNMTGQISQMGIAQKSFLSAQTGGGGGLMGAFQIDKMMRDGDLKGVFEKVRQQMQKQFGKIVTVDEASQSQGAAAQMTKQMMILKQGPLGQFARSDVEAERILEGFKAAGAGGGGGGLNPDILKETMDKGTSVQEKSYTVMSDMRGHLEAIHKAADIGTLGFVQKSGLTAGAGVNTAGMVQNEAAYKMSQGLKGSMAGAANMGTQGIGDSYAQANAQKKLMDSTGRAAVAAITGLQSTFKMVPDVIKGPAEALKQSITSGDTKGAMDQIKLLEAGIKKRKEDAKKLSVDKRGDAMAEIEKEEAVIGKAKAYFSAATGAAPVGVDLSGATGKGKAQPPGAKVGAAVPKATGIGTGVAPGAPTGGALGVGGANAGPGGPGKQDVTVHVTGFCLKCKQEIDNSAQANALSPQGKSI